MNKNNIVDIKSITLDSIDSDNYISALLQTLLKNKIISLDKYSDIASNFSKLLIKKINCYTGGLTSTLDIKVAQNIYSSILWTMGLYLGQKNIEESIYKLVDLPLDDLYNLSLNNLNEIVSKTHLFYKLIFMKSLIKTNNYFYNATLKDGIEGFFKIYNPSYDSESIFITLDYEPFIQRSNLIGIECIREYLYYINYENIFCNNFSYQKIDSLLRKIYINYKELPINIFEVIFTICIILKYLDISIYNLNVYDIDINILYNNFRINRRKYYDDLKKSYIYLKEELKFDSNTENYLDKCSCIAIEKIVYYTKNNNLNILLGKKQNKEINYIPNPRMSDSKFNELVELIRKSSDQEKIHIIRNIDSIFDVIDVLKSIELSLKELFNLFNNFKIIELMVLKKWYNDNDDDSIIFLVLNKYICTKTIKYQNIINKNYDFIVIGEIYER